MPFKNKYDKKAYASPVEQVYGKTGGEQHKLKFYHLPTKKAITFPAFLTAFDDSYTSNWAKEPVYGRMDPIAIFESTNRTLSLGFQIVPDSGTTARAYMILVQQLIQCLYPTYIQVGPEGAEKKNEFNVLSTAPVWRIKFANLLSSRAGALGTAKKSGQLCYITDLSFTPDLDQGFILSDNNIYPKKIDINMSLSILHDHTVGFINEEFQGGASYPYRVSGGSKRPPSFQDEGSWGSEKRKQTIKNLLVPKGWTAG